MKNGQWLWRVTVRSEHGDAYDVDWTDCHWPEWEPWRCANLRIPRAAFA